MPRIIALILTLLLPAAAGALTTQPLLNYDFQSLSGGPPQFENAPEQLVPGLYAGGWQLRDGTLDHAAGPNGSTSDLAMLGRSWGKGGNLFTLELVIEPGRQLLLDGYRFTEKASSSGPTSWELLLDDYSLDRGQTGTVFTTHARTLALGPLQGKVVLRLSAGGATSDNGTWRIDDFSLTGRLATVPLPASLLPLACALPLLGWRRRG